MDPIRMEVVAAIELIFADCQAAKSAALSEVNSFFEMPEFQSAVKAATGISDDKSAAIEWAIKRGALWLPFDMALTSVR